MADALERRRECAHEAVEAQARPPYIEEEGLQATQVEEEEPTSQPPGSDSVISYYLIKIYSYLIHFAHVQPDKGMVQEFHLSGRPKRPHRPPKRYCDIIPEPPIPIIPPAMESEEQADVNSDDDHHIPSELSSSTPSSQEGSSDSSGWVQTDPDAFNLFRRYHTSFPTYDPENMAYFDQFCDAPTFESTPEDQQPWYSGITSLLSTANDQYFAPFLNASTYRLMSWFYNSSSTKSLGDLDRLVNDVILAEDFNWEELRNFNASREGKRMDEAHASMESSQFSASDGWHETSLEIPLPCEKVKFPSEAGAPKFMVHGLHYRKFTEVIKSAYEEVPAKFFHTAPFKLFWQPDKSRPPERIISELYTADAMLHEQARITDDAPHVPGCALEMVIAAIMLWSDSTHLANFGNAALWPVYMFIGNLSKYTRMKPTSFSAHHLAYIPKVCCTLSHVCDANK